MKYVFVFLFISQSIFSQSGWFWQNPLPQGNSLNQLQILSANVAVCSNYYNLLRTSDKGESWQMIFTVFNSGISSIYMVDNNTGYILLDSTKIIKTTNGGLNWIFQSDISGFGYPSLSFINADIGFFSCFSNYNNKGLILKRTTNGALSWNIVLNDESFSLSSINFINASTGFMTGLVENLYNIKKLKIFKTTDSGINWDSVQNNQFISSIFSVVYVNSLTGFVNCNINEHDRIIKTTNGGNTWFEVCKPFENFGKLYFLNFDTGFLITDIFNYKTTDCGNNWTYYEYLNETMNDMYQAAFFDANTGIGIGEGGLIAKSTNGGINWSKKIDTYTNTLYDVSFADNNTGFAAGDEGLLFKTTNGGTNWTKLIFPALDDIGNIAKVNSSTWYFSHWMDGRILKTTNTGLSFDTSYANVYGITKLKFINETTGFGICKYNYFIKTTNGGLSWIVTSPFSHQSWSMDFLDENTGYVGSDFLYKTTNGGSNWDIVSNLQIYPSDIQFINSNTGFIGGIRGAAYPYDAVILKTTDRGNNWYSYFVAKGYLTELYFVNERTGFVRQYHRLFKSTNGGVNWFDLANTCSGNYLNTMYFTDTETGYIVGYFGTIIKTTNGGGEPIGINSISNQIPDKFILYQNYPNPFNPTTKIRFSIPSNVKRETPNVSLRIYDVLGNEVADITPPLGGGREGLIYEIEWNASNFASGVYFYSLQSGDFIETKKMVLIK